MGKGQKNNSSKRLLILEAFLALVAAAATVFMALAEAAALKLLTALERMEVYRMPAALALRAEPRVRPVILSLRMPWRI